MKHRSACGLASIVTCTALIGCGAHSHGGSHGGSFPTEAVATVAAAAAVGMIEAASQPKSSSGIDLDLPDYFVPPDPMPPGASDPTHVAFDPVPVLNAIDHLDLSPCTARGALIGWGRARLTFEPNGAVSSVVVETTDGLPEAAIECIRSELAAVSASRFEGAAITIGASYFVR